MKNNLPFLYIVLCLLIVTVAMFNPDSRRSYNIKSPKSQRHNLADARNRSISTTATTTAAPEATITEIAKENERPLSTPTVITDSYSAREGFLAFDNKGRLEMELTRGDSSLNANNTTILFTEHSYNGDQIKLAPGRYAPEQLAIRNITGDTIKSVTVPPNHSVTFYREPDFRPPQFTTTVDIPDLGGGDMKISSLVIDRQ